MTNNSLITNFYSELLVKELDTIQAGIKNLDDIIFKTKNFAILIWGGSLYLIADRLSQVKDISSSQMYLLSALIPALFWAMDFRWRKYILLAAERQRIISLFLNSEQFIKMVSNEILPPVGERFPVYDPVGWIYTMQSSRTDAQLPEHYFNTKYFTGNKPLSFFTILFYKDAVSFYGALLVLSCMLGLIA